MTQADFLARLRKATYTPGDKARVVEILDAVPGHSSAWHYCFAKTMLLEFNVQSVLVLGVLYGRDLLFWRENALQHGMSLRVVGVDRFRDAPCDDWTEGQRRAGTWAGAGYGTPPSLELARSFVGDHAELVKADAGDYLGTTAERFDLVYLDTSHDFHTVERQIKQSVRVLNPDGILAGDDYTPRSPTWGVDRAVGARTAWHCKFGEDIWAAHAGAIRE